MKTKIKSFPLALAAGSLAGCAGRAAPIFPLFGAYFPAWLLCSLGGVLGAIVARVLLAMTGLDELVPMQLLACAAIGVAVAALLWLLVVG